MSDNTNPFKGSRVEAKQSPMTVLYRFTKAGGHWAEIRERKVSKFGGFEFLVFMDGSLLESELFHGGRLPGYREALDARIKQFVDGGWIQEQSPDGVAH